jgi:hypothetical protein
MATTQGRVSSGRGRAQAPAGPIDSGTVELNLRSGVPRSRCVGVRGRARGARRRRSLGGRLGAQARLRARTSAQGEVASVASGMSARFHGLDARLYGFSARFDGHQDRSARWRRQQLN